MQHRKSSTNGVILSSIPINRKVKRYWQSKYERIVCNCGAEEACAKFKNLRVAVLSYIADSHRKANLNKFLASTGFRNNGYLRSLFQYAETQPHVVLSFLKLYSAKAKSTQSADAAAYACKRRLEAVSVTEATPRFLTDWLNTLCMRPWASFEYASKDANNSFHALAKNHSFDEWQRYWRKWYAIVARGWHSSSSLESKLVFPEIYKDYAPDDGDSGSYHRDFASLVSMHMTDESCLSQDELDFVDGFLNEDVGDALTAVLWGDEPSNQELSGIFTESSLIDGRFVGHVQHIHKKGGGTDLRDIAVPNRFIQAALVPGADRLYNLVRNLPQDATFDQDKFDAKIQNRVNNDNLYQGSVDLSKATDNLPFRWGDEIILHLQRYFGVPRERLLLQSLYGGVMNEEEAKKEWNFIKSYSLFESVAKANWEDEGFLLKWKVGQPLGSLPSFAVLAITHNFLLESMAAHLGYLHSPYVVLGDDVVIMNKRLRKRYIRELVSRGIPLSLHKSYEGRLSEFAGKTFVKSNVPFYTSDHNPVTWNSLFDWQRTTGIRIPWENLPKAIKAKVYKIVKDQSTEDLHKKQVIQLAKSSYDLVENCEIYGRGSHLYPIRDSAGWSDLIAGYFEYRITDSPTPEAQLHTGITLLRNGRPVVLMNSEFANKDGYFQRFRPVELPAWYRVKVRPCATDAAIVAACRSLNTYGRPETAS